MHPSDITKRKHVKSEEDFFNACRDQLSEKYHVFFSVRWYSEENGKRIIFDLPSDTEKKGFSIAMTAILDNNRIKTIGFEPRYEMKDAIHRTIEILK